MKRGEAIFGLTMKGRTMTAKRGRKLQKFDAQASNLQILIWVWWLECKVLIVVEGEGKEPWEGEENSDGEREKERPDLEFCIKMGFNGSHLLKISIGSSKI